MSAMPLEWHEECLRNSIESHNQRVRDLERAIEEERRSREDNERYAKQIERAKRLRKTSFDSEKFGIG
jgi:hypothetical protein